MVGIVNLSFAIITFAFLGIILSLNIFGGMEAFSICLKSATTKFVCFERKGIVGAACFFAFSHTYFVGGSPLAGVFIHTLFVSLIPIALIFASMFFVGGISEPFFSICALCFAKVISVGNSPFQMILSDQFSIFDSPFAAGFPLALWISKIIGASTFYFALTISMIVSTIALIKSLFIGGIPFVFVFSKSLFIGIGKFLSARIATLFASAFNAIATILVRYKVFTCSWLSFTALGASLLGNFCGMIGHSNSLLMAVAQAWDTSRVLPGTLYWFFRPQYNTVWGVSQ